MQGLGGTVEAAYFAFGGSGADVIVDLPDNASAAAVAPPVARQVAEAVLEIVDDKADREDRGGDGEVGEVPRESAHEVRTS